MPLRDATQAVIRLVRVTPRQVKMKESNRHSKFEYRYGLNPTILHEHTRKVITYEERNYYKSLFPKIVFTAFFHLLLA